MAFTTKAAAQVDPNLDTRLQQAPIIVDRNSIILFEQIPEVYIQRAQNIRMMWGDRSVGGNIHGGLDCLQYPTDEQALTSCKRNHVDPAYDSPDWLTDWDRPGGYNRSNWHFYFDPGLGVTPELSCVTNVAWIGCFIEHVRANINNYDVFSYQHSYLTIQPGSDINGYFSANTNRTDIYDYEQLENDFPNKVFFYWTTSLARPLGSLEGEEYATRMRQWANDRHKILFDMADIISHPPTNTRGVLLSNTCYDSRDGVCWCRDPSTGSGCETYQIEGQPCDWNDFQNITAICQHYTTEPIGGHLQDAPKVMMAKAYWVLMAQIAGWQPGVVSPSASPNPAYTPVGISDSGFSPSTLTVPVGTTVRWTNNGALPHTVTANGGQFSSGTINPGNTYNFTFNQPGTYTYSCQFHPSMTGTIVVTGPTPTYRELLQQWLTSTGDQNGDNKVNSLDFSLVIP